MFVRVHGCRMRSKNLIYALLLAQALASQGLQLRITHGLHIVLVMRIHETMNTATRRWTAASSIVNCIRLQSLVVARVDRSREWLFHASVAKTAGQTCRRKILTYTTHRLSYCSNRTNYTAPIFLYKHAIVQSGFRL